LSDQAATAWCEAQNWGFDARSARVADWTGGGDRIRVTIPDEATTVTALSYVLLMTGVPGYEETALGDTLLWLRRWAIWSESIDRVGHVLLDAVHKGAGNEDIDSAPALLFTMHEFPEAHACLTLPMLFQWDAVLVSSVGKFAAVISHDGFVDLFWKEQDFASKLFDRFRDWQPELLAG